MPPAARRKVQRILLVDDEALVRETLAPYLATKLLLEVRTAPSGEAALELLRREDFAVVLADQEMPGLTGVALMRAIREAHPGVARLLMTRHREASLREAAESPGTVQAVVQKPYSLRAVAKLLRRAVDDAASLPRPR